MLKASSHFSQLFLCLVNKYIYICGEYVRKVFITVFIRAEQQRQCKPFSIFDGARLDFHVEHFLNSVLYLSGKYIPQRVFGKVKGEPSATFNQTKRRCVTTTRGFLLFPVMRYPPCGWWPPLTGVFGLVLAKVSSGAK